VLFNKETDRTILHSPRNVQGFTLLSNSSQLGILAHNLFI